MTNILHQPTNRVWLKRTRSAILASLILGAIALPFTMPVQKLRANDGDSGRGDNSDALLGTWLVEVSINPQTVPPGSVLNFMVVQTYGAGGGVLEGGRGNGAGGVGGGPDAHGNWLRIGGRHYAATSSASGFDDAHHYTLETKIRESLTLNQRGDELIGRFQVDLTPADGTLLPFHPAGTYHGVRMPIEPLN